MAQSDEERAQILQMQEALGLQRREVISTPYTDHRGRLLKGDECVQDAEVATIIDQHRQIVERNGVGSGNSTAISAWNGELPIAPKDP